MASRPFMLLSLSSLLVQLASGYVLHTPPPLASHIAQRRCASPALMALDYKDPLVAKEFTAIQALDTEAVEDELAQSGIPVPPTMNDMDMRMMLVEMRMRKAGKVGSAKPKAKKAPEGASDFEKALYEKPAFNALYTEWQAARNTNALNLATEHINNPRRAKERYGATAKYDETIAAIEAALKAKVEVVVDSALIAFAGFPANMGEAGVKMTLEAFGSLKSFKWEPDDDGISSSGQAEFDEISAAKAAVDKYDGMDMGLGTALSFESL